MITIFKKCYNKYIKETGKIPGGLTSQPKETGGGILEGPPHGKPSHKTYIHETHGHIVIPKKYMDIAKEISKETGEPLQLDQLMEWVVNKQQEDFNNRMNEKITFTTTKPQ